MDADVSTPAARSAPALAGEAAQRLERPAVRGERLDLITLDMQLDEMDAGGQHGMVLLDQINIHQRGVPVIIISGLTWSETQVRDFLRKYRAFDYVKKPFTPDSLRPILVEALNQEP